MVLLLLLCSFEYRGETGRSTAMLAGAAVLDAQHSFSLNPALCVGDGRFQAGVFCSRPYGLAGLSWGRAAGVWSSRGLAAGAALSLLGLNGYSEEDASMVLGGMPVPGMVVGIGIHALIVNASRPYGDMAPSFDAGACWRYSRFSLGVAVLRLNSPRWREGTEVPPRLVLGSSWTPVDEVLLALDVIRESGIEDATFGAEVRPVPQLGIRMGGGVAPLRYAAGLVAMVGRVGLEYTYRFQSALGESHVLGLRAAWQ